MTLLGSATIDFQSTSDQEIPMSAAEYIIRRVTFTHASGRPLDAAGAVYPLAEEGGNPITSPTQTYSALVNFTNFLDVAVEPTASTHTLSTPALYLRLDTPSSRIATGLVLVWGDVLA